MGISKFVNKYLGRYQHLKILDLDQLFPAASSNPTTIVDYTYVYGNLPVSELLILCQIVRYKNPKTLFEIGTFRGETTLQLAVNTEAEIYTLDLSLNCLKQIKETKIGDPSLDVYTDQVGVRFSGTRYSSRINQLYGNSQTFDFTAYYDKVDVIFVDGSHHYEFVLRDSQNALKMVNRNGLIIWHDYSTYAPGVVKALHRIAQSKSLINIAGTSLVVHQVH